MSDIPDRVHEAMRRLNYDFRQFTLSHFIQHLIQQRQRPIILKPFPIHREIYAVWIKMDGADYIAYNENTHPTHQIHSVLHEVGHMVLGHSGRNLNEVLPPELLASSPVFGQLRTIRAMDSLEEQEAEAFGTLLQEQIIVANRMEQLTGRASGIKELERFAGSLGYHA